MSQIIECESALFYQRAVWIWELMGVEMCFVSSFHLVKNLQGLTSPPPMGILGTLKMIRFSPNKDSDLNMHMQNFVHNFWHQEPRDFRKRVPVTEKW